MVYRVDARGSLGREQFVAAVMVDDFARARDLFDAVPGPPGGLAMWLTRKLEARMGEALGPPLAVILRPAMGELLAVWGGRRGLRGPWCLTADGRPIALGHDDHVAVDPGLSEEERALLVTRGVFGP